MGDQSGIEWTDATWNPVTGFDVVLRPERLDQPLRWKRPRRVFVNSMSDLFHAAIPDEYIARVFAVMALAPQHTFQVLTKRHGRMRSLVSSAAFRVQVLDAAYKMSVGETTPIPSAVAQEYRERVTTTLALSHITEVESPSAMPWPLPNLWLGVSVENQQWANIRIPALLDTPAAVRFLSCEPLLGEVSLFANSRIDTGHLVDWVIVGGESGRGARPMHPAWARGLRDECTTYGIAFHFKQWGAWAPSQGRRPEQGFMWRDGDLETRPASLVTSPVGGDRYVANDVPMRPGWTNIERVGKAAAGRELDGRTWDEWPRSPEGLVIR